MIRRKSMLAKRILSIILVLSMVLSILPTKANNIWAAEEDVNVSEMDALSALGIDTSKPPEGYDPHSGNPYGKDTVTVNPVKELYQFGLSKNTSVLETRRAVGGSEEFNISHIIKNQTIRGSLYGDGSQGKSTSAIMRDVKYKEVAEGGEWLENPDYDENGHFVNSPFMHWEINPDYDENKESVNSPFLLDYNKKWVKNFLYDPNAESINPSHIYSEEWVENPDYDPEKPSTNPSHMDSGDMVIIGKYKRSGSYAYLQSDGYKVENNLTLNGENFNIAASKVASANFDGNKEGKTAQTVLVYIEEASQSGGLSMRIGEARTGEYGDKKELISTSKSIGNPKDKFSDIKEDFVTDPYLMQNYLQVTTGDYDGDGVDEIAVFIPELNHSRIEVYKLRETTGQTNTSYRDGDQWEIAWTYSLKESDYVSNMVSLVSGDFNQDGVTDLGATWGYYYGPERNKRSKAVIMFGARGNMLQKSQEFDLEEGDSEIIRASFTFGDLTGSGRSALVLGGELSEDIRSKRTSRYVAIYDWDGTSFVKSSSKNFDLFGKDKDGNYINSKMKFNKDKFYSSSLCPANIAVLSQGLAGGEDSSAYLYLDSLLIKYDENDGLVIDSPLDQHGPNAGNRSFYVEYGGVSGDFVGLGNSTLATMQQTMSEIVPHMENEYKTEYYYKNWWDKLWGKKSYRTKIVEGKTVGANEFKKGKTFRIIINPSEGYNPKIEVDQSTSICLTNTDDDTVYMTYQGKRFEYSDPNVLAVVSSPPFFKDLLDRGDLSGNYAESTTSYGSTKGKGSAVTFNTTIEVGTYVNFSQDISVFGVKLGSVEAEASISAGFTFETEQGKMLEQTVSYSATSGEDMVAFFSIPLEIYEYEAFIPNANGVYESQYMTVNVPHIAAVEMIPLDKYENIAKDYEILPQIADNVVKHVVGDPTTYSENTNGYLKPIAYDGDWARVGYTSKDGGDSISQEISMTKESINSFNIYTRIDAKAGAGPGGVVVGVTAGAEIGLGGVFTSTSGNSFSGDLQNMPIEAEEFGYSHAWKIFSYLYDDGKMSFPVVDYLVRDVVAPPKLPEDFKQDIDNTNDTEIALSWSYDKSVAGFQIYRYYEFPDGTGSYELGFVPMTKGILNKDDGLYHFEYIDKNLSPYTDYKYQIQTVRSSRPNNSIPSEVITARTKTDVGYPEISLEGLDEDGFHKIYPDSETSITAKIMNIEEYKGGASYQWQKFDKGIWVDMPGKKSDKLTFKVSGVSDQTRYRCRTNLIFYDVNRGKEYQISAYSDEFETKYSKRKPAVLVPGGFTATTYNKDSGGMGVRIKLKLISDNVNHYIAPTGKVTFTVKGNNYEKSYIAGLNDSKNKDANDKFISSATQEIDDLPEGVYEVSGYYSGNRAFQSLTTDKSETFLIGESGYQLLLEKDNVASTRYTYGEEISPTLKSVENIGGSAETTIISEGVKYFIDNKEIDLNDGKFKTSNIGTYTVEARISNKNVADRTFTVEKREIDIKAKQLETVGKGNVESNPPELEILLGNMAFEEALDDLDLEIIATNSADNRVELNNETEPGNYTIIGGPSKSTDTTAYNNYKVNYISGVYTIIGQTYLVKIEAEKYLENRDAGAIELLNAKDNSEMKFSAGTELLFLAKPYKGYEVDSWIATGGSENIEITDKMLNPMKTRLSITMRSEETSVKVRFKKSNISLTTAKEGEGIIKCSNPSFVNGASISEDAEFEFTAIPADGYVFKEWKVESGGVSLIKTGILNEDGSNTITHRMGAKDTILRAVFEREKYTIRLSGNLEATYQYLVGDVEGNWAEKTVFDGAKIPGGTEVIVKAKAGYKVDSSVSWTVNGDAVTPVDGVYKFTIEEDTTILADADQQSYQITKKEENGTISVSINGVEATELNYIPGGSEVVFTAHPNHGYVFKDFQLEGTDKYTKDGVRLTIKELGSDVSIKANFVENIGYNAKVNFGNRGTAEYILYDAFDKEVERKSIETGENVRIYKNDRMELIITSEIGYMIDMWKINGVIDNTRNKKYIFENINKDLEINVVIISQSSYTVNYSVHGGNGSIISATTDGREFESGDTDVGGGSTIVVRSNPNENYMVEKWEIDGVIVGNEDGTEFVGKDLIIDSLVPTSTIVDIKVYFTSSKEHTVNLVATNVSIEEQYTPDEASIGKVRDGAKGVFTIIPQEGYRIVSAEVVGGDNRESNIRTIKNPDSYTDDYGTWTITVDQIKDNMEVIARAKKIHTIRIDNVDGGELASTTTTSYPEQAIEGEEVKLYQVSELDYTFDGWNVSGDGMVNVAGNVKDDFFFIMPDSDVIVSADFMAIETIDISYEVYDKNEEEEDGYDGMLSGYVSRNGAVITDHTFNNEISGKITSINRGFADDYVMWPMSTVRFTASPDDGYKVLKWLVDGVEIPNTMNILELDVKESTVDMQVIVQFEPIGEGISYAVDGNNGKFVSVINELTGNEFISGNIISQATNILFEVEADEGYEVEAWMVNGDPVQEGPNSRYEYLADGENGASITVKFARVPYRVEYYGENGSVVSSQVGESVRGDTEVTFTAEANPGYKFDGYTVLGSTNYIENNKFLTVTITEDTIVIANFITDENCTVEYGVVNSKGSLEAIKDDIIFATGSMAAANDLIRFIATPDVNYKVKSWIVDGLIHESHENTFDLIVSDINHKVLVEFERSHYIVNFSINGGNGQMTAESISYISTGSSLVKGSSINFIAVADSGYQVRAWIMDGVEIANSREKLSYEVENLSKDISVSVEFEEIPEYKITIAKTGTGEGTVKAFVNDIETPVDNGILIVKNHDRVRFVAIPEDEYNTATWTTNALSDYEINGTEILLKDVTSDINVFTLFKAAELITVKADAVKASEADPNVNGSISAKAGYGKNLETIKVVESTVTVTKGKTLKFTAIPESGYMVKTWLVNDKVVGELSNTLTMVAETNINVKVMFEEITAYKIPLDGENYTVRNIIKTPDELGSSYIDSIRARGTVVFDLIPEAGYYFNELSIFDMNCLLNKSSDKGIIENTIQVIENQDYSYTITISNVMEDIVVGGKAVKPIITIEEAEFGDITASYSYIDEMQELQTINVNSGDMVPIDTQLIVKASSHNGYRFKSWGDFALNSRKNPIEIVIANDNYILSGEFEKISSGGGGGSFVPPIKATEDKKESPIEIAIRNARKNEDGKLVARIELNDRNNEGEYEIIIPKEFFSYEDKVIEITTLAGIVSFPDDMFDEMPNEDVRVRIKQVDSKGLNLPQGIIEQIGDKPILDVNLAIGKKSIQWKNKKNEITVSIPYTLTEKEKNGEHKVIASYMDKDGNITPIILSKYDHNKASIVFKANHTGYYLIQYVDNGFDDIDNYTWAKEAIEALAARGVIQGVSETKFVPQNNIKRADFVLLITRFLGLGSPDNTNFADVEKGTYYYNDVSTAKKLGIISGVGENMFHPENPISREDMMVIIERALRIANIKDRITGKNHKSLEEFNDRSNISDYAANSIDYLVESGIVEGTGDSILPKSNAKRGEVAVVIYKLLKEMN